MSELNKDNNNQQQKKTKIVKKKSAIPTVAVGLIFLAAILSGAYRSLYSMIVTTVIAFVVSGILKNKFPPNEEEITIENEQESAETPKEETPDVKITQKTGDKPVDDFISKGELYITEIKLLNDAISDTEISKNLSVIEDTLRKMFDKLRSEKDKPRRITQLNQFMEYYMPTTVKILDSYRKIEQNSLTGVNVNETKKRISDTLPFIRDAFLNELDNMYKDEMIDITTDIDVLEQMLSKDGLIDKNNIDINKFNKGAN